MYLINPTSLTTRFFYKANLIGFILLFAHLSACKSKVPSASDEEVLQTKTEESIEGMSAATIVNYSERDADCSFIFILEEDGKLLQSISIPEDFQQDNLKVWIDFTYSRRQQGPCAFGAPINLTNLLIRYE